MAEGLLAVPGRHLWVQALVQRLDLEKDQAHGASLGSAVEQLVLGRLIQERALGLRVEMHLDAGTMAGTPMRQAPVKPTSHE